MNVIGFRSAYFDGPAQPLGFTNRPGLTYYSPIVGWEQNRNSTQNCVREEEGTTGQLSLNEVIKLFDFLSRPELVYSNTL
jgi:hypothetical protein